MKQEKSRTGLWMCFMRIAELVFFLEILCSLYKFSWEKGPSKEVFRNWNPADAVTLNKPPLLRRPPFLIFYQKVRNWQVAASDNMRIAFGCLSTPLYIKKSLSSCPFLLSMFYFISLIFINENQEVWI